MDMSFAHPFARIVVAYDASPPADAALARCCVGSTPI
jgi:hypothetical protein